MTGFLKEKHVFLKTFLWGIFFKKLQITSLSQIFFDLNNFQMVLDIMGHPVKRYFLIRSKTLYKLNLFSAKTVDHNEYKYRR